MLTQERLKEVIHYNSETGIFTWKKRVAQCVRIGDIAGYLDDGYVLIGIDYEIHKAHRLAWLYMTGGWPKKEIDHINMVRDDNRWSNIREATHAQNEHNSRKRVNNTTGFKGVFKELELHNKRNPFRARIRVNGTRISLGTFDCPAAAHFAYIIAADVHHGEFARADSWPEK